MFQEQDPAMQGTFLMGLIHVTNVKRRRHGIYKSPEESRRQASIIYTVPNATGKLVQVCKNTFVDIFRVSSRRIQTLIKKKKAGHSIYVDERKLRPPVCKYSNTHRSLVKEHILSIPNMQQFSRVKSDKGYLTLDLNVSQLYRNFKELHPDTSVSRSFYRTVYNQEFSNLSVKREKVN